MRLKVLIPIADFQIFQNLFYIACIILFADQSGVFRVHNNQILQPYSGNQLPSPLDDAVLGIYCNNISIHHISKLIGLLYALHREP